MRILIAGANASAVGGAEIYQRTVAAGLGNAGHDVAFLHERAPVPRFPSISPSERNPKWCIEELGKAPALASVRAWGPMVLYVQGLASPKLEATLLDLSPAVLFAHNYYGTCATGTKRHAWPSIRFCERRLGKLCIPINYLRGCGARSPFALLRTYGLQSARLENLVRYRAVCVASEHMRREYLRHGAEPERLHVVPPSAGDIIPSSGPPPQSGRVLLSGRLTPLKGFGHAVVAVDEARRHLGRQLTLVVMGEGPGLPILRRQAERLGVDLETHGWLDFHARNALLRTVELLMIPSLWPEPWGLVGLEAACAGVPAAAYRSGGIPEWLISGENGELAPADPPRPRKLAEALTRALQDRAHYEHLSRNALKQAARLNIACHVERIIPILHRAVSET